MVTIEKKQNEQKQGGNPSVVDAFISALFASTHSSSSSNATTTPYISTTSELSSVDKEKAKSEYTRVQRPISLGANVHEANIDEEYIPAVRSTPTNEPTGYSETLSATASTTAAKTKTSVKRDRSLTEDVEAYSQLSKRKVAQPSTTTSDSKRFDERDYQRRDYKRGLGEGENVSPGQSGSDRLAYDHHQQQRYQNQQNHQIQQQHTSNNQTAPSSSTYRGKADIVAHHLQAQRGQPASSTYILALKPVDWSTAVAESRMLIRDVPTHMDNWDLLDHFAPYGEIIEVVIKNQLGFVHFADANACLSAVKSENGKFIKDFKLRLEVCKQKPHFARSHTAAPKSTASSKNIQHQVPVENTHVHLIVWGHVPPAYVNHVSQSFEHASLSTQISYLVNRSTSNQEQMIREKVNAGAVAILNLESSHEQQRTVDLRVLKKSSNEDIHFEAYDSISLNDAIALTKIGCRSNRSTSKSPPRQRDPTAPLRNPSPPQQLPLDLVTLQQLDVNTLATIYDLVHVQLETALAAHQRTTPVQQQYAYPSHNMSPAPYHLTPALPYQGPQPLFSHNAPPSSTTPLHGGHFQNYSQYPPSPQMFAAPTTTPAAIQLSTEQLGNILSSVNNNQ